VIRDPEWPESLSSPEHHLYESSFWHGTHQSLAIGRLIQMAYTERTCRRARVGAIIE
jgi:hypothetical protein